MTCCRTLDIASMELGLTQAHVATSTTDKRGGTALHHLLQTKPPLLEHRAPLLRAVELLASNGAEEEVKGLDVTKLRYFQMFCDVLPEVVLLLLRLGARYNTQDPPSIDSDMHAITAKRRKRGQFRGKRYRVFWKEAVWARRRAFAVVFHCALSDPHPSSVQEEVLGNFDLARYIAGFI